MELRTEESAVLRAAVALCAHGASVPASVHVEVLTAAGIEKFLRVHDPDVAGALDETGVVGILERLWQLDLLNRIGREDPMTFRPIAALWVPTAAAFYAVLGPAAYVSQGLGRLAKPVAG